MNSNTSPIRRSIERTTVFESPCKQVQGRQWPPCESPRCFPTEAFLSLAHTLCKPFSYSSRTTSGHRSTRFFFLRFSMESRDEWIQKFRTKKKHRLAIRHWPPSRFDRFPPKQKKKRYLSLAESQETYGRFAHPPGLFSLMMRKILLFFFLPPLPTEEEEAARLYKQRGDLLNKCIAADNRSTWLDTGGRKEEKKISK